MESPVNERRIMGVWIFDIADTGTARALYDALPPPLKHGCELRTALDGGHLLAPSEDAARWLREQASRRDIAA